MDSLKQNNVYEEIRGRTLGGEGSPAPDVICEGFTALTWGAKSPLKQFNRTIKTLQRCCSVQPLVGTTAPTQTPDTRKFLCLCTIGLLTLHILANSDFSSSEENCTHTGNNCDNDEESELDEDLAQALNETQPVLSLETADDVDLEMDADLLVHADPLDEGDETDISEGEGMDELV
jgi:hypothetical protein